MCALRLGWSMFYAICICWFSVFFHFSFVFPSMKKKMYRSQSPPSLQLVVNAFDSILVGTLLNKLWWNACKCQCQKFCCYYWQSSWNLYSKTIPFWLKRTFGNAKTMIQQGYLLCFLFQSLKQAYCFVTIIGEIVWLFGCIKLPNQVFKILLLNWH